MANLSYEEALEIAKQARAHELSNGMINSVDVEELPNGWRVTASADKPVIGMGPLFITASGEVKSYPSSMSPRQAEEQFAADNPLA